MRAEDGYGQYAKGDWLFLYQYRRPPNPTVRQIVDLGVRYTEAARTYVAQPPG